MNRDTNIAKIETFKELMDWISYDWDYSYTLKKVDGGFVVNKLYITPTRLTYKTECGELAEGLYEKLEKLYSLLEEK